MGNEQLGSILRHIRKLTGAPPCAEPSDGKLLHRFARLREEMPFEELLRRHGPMVLGVCRRVLRNEHDAEDSFQATFLVLARKAGSISRAESVGSWLHGVAYRIAQRARTVNFKRNEVELSLPLPEGEMEPVVEAAWRELRDLLDQELARLPSRYRAPLILCTLEGKSKREAALELGWKEGTLSGRLARAREMLRGRLIRRGVLLSAIAAASEVSAPKVSAALAGRTLATALSFAAKHSGTTAVTGSVISLSEGVLKAMWITKMKVIASVLLALGAISAGTGLLGSGAFQADNPQGQSTKRSEFGLKKGDDRAPKPAAQDPGKDERENAFQAEKKRARSEAEELATKLAEREQQQQVLEEDLLKHESKWSEELIAARMLQFKADEQFRAIEREHKLKREEEVIAIEAAKSPPKVPLARRMDEQINLEKQLQYVDSSSPQALKLKASIERLTKEIAAAEEKAKVETERLNTQLKSSEELRATRLLESRRDVVSAEERLHLLERRQAMQRERLQTRLQELDPRRNLKQADDPRSDSTNRRLQELEHKLDQLLREVAELRREKK